MLFGFAHGGVQLVMALVLQMGHSLIKYLGEEFNLQGALDKAHDPGFNAEMTTIAYRAQRKFINQ